VITFSDPAVLEEQGAEQDTGDSAQQHVTEGAPRDVAAHDLRGHEDELDDGRKHQPDADGDRSGHAKEQHEDRHGNGAGAHAGERDEERDDESDEVWHRKAGPSLRSG